MTGFKIETGLSPNAKEISSLALSHQEEIRSTRFVKLKSKKQVKEPMTPLVVQDTPQQSQRKKVQINEVVQEQSIDKMSKEE